MSPLNRRQFLGSAVGAAGLAALGLGCGREEVETGSPGSTAPGTTVPAPRVETLPDPTTAPFDTVVVLMMENRSFDHVLGWLPGADGRQTGLSYRDAAGAMHDTWPLAPDWQGCAYTGPAHDVVAMRTQFADGACDGFLLTEEVGDRYPIGYYTAEDLPILAALAQGYTTFDRYFSSVMGPTWPNRLYQLCATADLAETGTFPRGEHDERPSRLTTTIFDRVLEAGLTAGYYAFEEPMTGLFASKRYDAISHTFDDFLADATAGRLPNVVFVDPDFAIEELIDDTTNSMHPSGSVKVGDAFLGQVHDALTSSPQWDRLVAFVNFDESGGFFDHVPPPQVPDDTVMDAEVVPDFTRLGFRVPAIAISPFAPARVESAGPFEHCSILKLIEWRWGLEPLTARDRHAANIAAGLDFTARHDPITLPPASDPDYIDCRQAGTTTTVNRPRT